MFDDEQAKIGIIISFVIFLSMMIAYYSDQKNITTTCVEWGTMEVTQRKILAIIPTYETKEEKYCIRYESKWGEEQSESIQYGGEQ